MKINVKILNGRDSWLTVSENTSILELKELVHQHLDIPIDQQRIVFKGKALHDSSNLKSSGVEADSKVMVTVVKDSDKLPPSIRADDSTSRPKVEVGRNSMFLRELQKLLSRHFTQDGADRVLEQFVKNWPQHVQKHSLKQNC